MLGILYFIITLVMFVLVANALRPAATGMNAALRPPWFPVMLVHEIAPTILIGAIVWVIVGIGVDVGATSLGTLSLWMVALSIAGLVGMLVTAMLTPVTLRRVGLTVSGATGLRPSVLWPDPYRMPDGIDVDTHEYRAGSNLDVYRRAGGSGSRPVLLHVHGGSWSGGDRKQQARPLIHRLALGDWVVVSIDYPLVPEATFPEPLVAVHDAIRWVRDNADDLGVDPASLFLTGGSSGAHLASLAGLTDDHRDWGRRVPDDPPIAGVVAFYGVFDLLDRYGVRDPWPIVSRGLIKADRDAEPQKFKDASPLDHVRADAPPFLVIHGRHDSLVPPVESRNFVEALRSVASNEVTLLELHGASHAFDAIPSIRTHHVAAGVEQWLEEALGTQG